MSLTSLNNRRVIDEAKNQILCRRYGGKIIPPKGIDKNRWNAILKQVENHYAEFGD